MSAPLPEAVERALALLDTEVVDGANGPRAVLYGVEELRAAVAAALADATRASVERRAAFLGVEALREELGEARRVVDAAVAWAEAPSFDNATTSALLDAVADYQYWAAKRGTGGVS